MKLVSLCSGLSLSVCLALALGAGCAGDDKKVALRDGAGAEGGEGLGGDGPASGGSQGSGASSGTSPAGTAGGAGGESDGGGSAEGGSSAGGNSAGGTGEGGSNGNQAGAPAAGGGTGSGEAGAGGVATSEPTPVPSNCLACASDVCVAARVACQNDATCVSCRDDDYRTLACAQNAAFTGWITCICAAGCIEACASLCGS